MPAYMVKNRQGTVMGVLPVSLDSATSQSSDKTKSAPQTAWFEAKIAALEATLADYETALAGYQTVLTNCTARLTAAEQRIAVLENS